MPVVLWYHLPQVVLLLLLLPLLLLLKLVCFHHDHDFTYLHDKFCVET